MCGRYEALERERVAAEAMEARAVLERRRLERRHTDAFMRVPPAGQHTLLRHRTTRPSPYLPQTSPPRESSVRLGWTTIHW